MIRLVRRNFIVALVAIAALLCWQVGICPPVLCLHADGGTALETGDDDCCLSGVAAAGPAGAPAMHETEGGHCPGCRDVLLTSAAERPARTSTARPLGPIAPLAYAAPARLGLWTASRTTATAARDVSSPLALPLRV